MQNGGHDVVLITEQQGESNARLVLKFKGRDRIVARRNSKSSSGFESPSPSTSSESPLYSMLNNIGIVFTSGIGNEIVENIKYEWHRRSGGITSFKGVFLTLL